MLATGLGLPAGPVLHAATHPSTLPALGLRAPLTRLPRAAWVWEPGSHLVYGAAVEVVRRAVRAALART